MPLARARPASGRLAAERRLPGSKTALGEAAGRCRRRPAVDAAGRPPDIGHEYSLGTDQSRRIRRRRVARAVRAGPLRGRRRRRAAPCGADAARERAASMSARMPVVADRPHRDHRDRRRPEGRGPGRTRRSSSGRSMRGGGAARSPSVWRRCGAGRVPRSCTAGRSADAVTGRRPGDRPDAHRQRGQGSAARWREAACPGGRIRLRLDHRRGAAGSAAGVAEVTVRRMLNHTSGLPDYTESDGFAKQSRHRSARLRVSAAGSSDWVRADPLEFTPGSRYEYSNTDNIVIGLIAQSGHRTALRRACSSDIVFRPAGLRETSVPDQRSALPRPFLHGYVIEPGEPRQDVSDARSARRGAWASGAVVSTPAELNAFIRGLLGAAVLGAAQQREQLRFVGRRPRPARPARAQNAAGLAVFRYRTRCGTVYGHTGNYPGYVQFMAATRTGALRDQLVHASPRRQAPCWLSCARCRRPPCACCCGARPARRRPSPRTAREVGQRVQVEPQRRAAVGACAAAAPAP